MALDDQILQKHLFSKSPRKHTITTNRRVFDDPSEFDSSVAIVEIPDKPRTNTGQSADKLKTELRTNTGQSSSEIIPTSPSPTLTNPPAASLNATRNLGQIQDKPKTIIDERTYFSSLVGLQRQITLFLYDNCRGIGGRITSPLSVETIASSCSTTSLSVQKTIQRLEKKGVVARYRFKNGRGGWTQYEVPESMYQEILLWETQDKVRTNLGQTTDKVRTEILSTPSNSQLSEPTLASPPPATYNLDFSELDEIGFTRHHQRELERLIEKNVLTEEEVQESIYAFAFDIKTNDKKSKVKGDIISYFIGILRKGPYLPPSNYESPLMRQRREYNQRKKAQLDALIKQEQEAFRLEFEIWLQQTSPEEKKKIVLLNAGSNVEENGPIWRATLSNHFKEEIWPALPKI